MRNQGVEIKDWPLHRQQLSVRFFISDLLREHNIFVAETMRAWHISPDKNRENAQAINETIDDHRSYTLYNNFVDKSNKKKSKEESDKEILNRVANLSEDINEL